MVTLSATLTLPGSILGTIGFMAPEQAFGRPITAASDQFSFCVTTYLALYGRNPFTFAGVSEYFTALDRPLPPSPSGSDVPPWIHRILVRGLSREPEESLPVDGGAACRARG